MMVSNDKRYSDLPHEVRAFLETLTGEGVTTLSNVVRFYERISQAEADRVSALHFLENAKPRTFEWLKDARPDEIDQLDDAVKLVRSSRTVGRFMKWALGIFFGSLIIMSQFGEALTKLWQFIRPMK